jgi:hypothetical protein
MNSAMLGFSLTWNSNMLSPEGLRMADGRSAQFACMIARLDTHEAVAGSGR